MVIGKDEDDVVFRTAREKFSAIADEIAKVQPQGQPILVGTASVERSELLSSLLAKKNIPHEVLNAKNHAREATIIAEAGHSGHVTIATNMAGRGTDIVLGPGVKENGGLYVIGTERHESRRIDNQLRGRSGRQGDLGKSKFFLSLEDDLMRIFASDRLSGVMARLGMEDGEAIVSPMVSRAIEKAQKREKDVKDQIASLEEQKQSVQVLKRDLTDTQKPPEKLAQSDSILDSLREGLDKTRKNILNNLSDAVLGKKEINDELLDDLEEILISSDIGPETTNRILEAITKKVKREELTNPQTLRLEIEREIQLILTKKYQVLGTSDRKPLILLFVGVNGVGKTTSIGKIAAQYRQQGKKVLIGAGDTFRAAAIEQLDEWSKRADCDIVHKDAGTDPSAVIFESVQKGIDDDYDVVICDTAGRLHTKKNLMEELKKMVRVIRKLIPDAPHEVFLVLDATTGQNAIFQTREFLQAAELTGLIITKLDGTSKGGVVIGIVNEFEIPVRYIGLGEQLEDLRPFNADQFTKSSIQLDRSIGQLTQVVYTDNCQMDVNSGVFMIHFAMNERLL